MLNVICYRIVRNYNKQNELFCKLADGIRHSQCEKLSFSVCSLLLFPLNSNLKQIEDITDNVHEFINLHRPT